MKKLMLVTIFAFTGHAHAWGPTGHRVVGEIAETQLTAQASAKIKELLKGATLADVANWADEIRDDPSKKNVAPLHYATVADPSKTYQESPKAPEGDVVVAINTLVEFLRKDDPLVLYKLPPLIGISRAEAVKFLVHFVGDLHQPLHVGGTDRGGNDVRVTWFKKVSTNLHSVWDDEMIDYERYGYLEFAAFLMRAFREQIPNWGNGVVEDWANESIRFRPSIYIFSDEKTPPKDGEPHLVSYSYVAKNRQTLRQRLTQGGVRLAQLLNSIFADKPQIEGLP